MEKELKILVIDIETTGFLTQGGKIVEIGIVELDLISGAKKCIFDQVMHETGITKEEVENSWIVKNEHMTTEEIRHSKNLDKYRDEIQDIINRYPLGATAYNNVFDFGFLENRGFEFPKKLPCPMKLSTNIVKIEGRYGRYKWPSAEEAYNFFYPKAEYNELHRGADDAMHEASVIKALYDKKIFTIN